MTNKENQKGRAYLYQLEKDAITLRAALELRQPVQMDVVRNVIGALSMEASERESQHESLREEMDETMVFNMKRSILDEIYEIITSPVFKVIVERSPEKVGMTEDQRAHLHKKIGAFLGYRTVKPQAARPV